MENFFSFSTIKRFVSISDVLEAAAYSGPLRQIADGIVGICPLPTHVHSGQFNPTQFRAELRSDRWLWHCFACGAGGDVIEFAELMTGLDTKTIGRWFAQRFGDRLAKTSSEDRTGTVAKEHKPHGEQLMATTTRRTADVACGRASRPLPFRLSLDPTAEYLRYRGVSSQTIERYGIGLSMRGTLRNYVAIPVHRWPGEPDENPVAYLGRRASDTVEDEAKLPRYKWPKGFKKSNFVFGLPQALDDSSDTPLMVAEGPFDVFALCDAGFPQSVAVFGSSLSAMQAEILAGTGRRVVLMFDGDAAGRLGVQRAAKLLDGTMRVRIANVPAGKQPGDLSARELIDLL